LPFQKVLARLFIVDWGWADLVPRWPLVKNWFLGYRVQNLENEFQSNRHFIQVRVHPIAFPKNPGEALYRGLGLSCPGAKMTLGEKLISWLPNTKPREWVSVKPPLYTSQSAPNCFSKKSWRSSLSWIGAELSWCQDDPWWKTDFWATEYKTSRMSFSQTATLYKLECT
jgi:hypothetical protein